MATNYLTKLLIPLFLGLEKTIATNYLGPMYLTKLLIPLFLGLEKTMATNHLGPMYLTKLLVPLLTPKVYFYTNCSLSFLGIKFPPPILKK